MSAILHTPRLTISKFTVADAPFILELVNTPTWIRFIGDRNIHTLTEAEAYVLNGPMASYEKHGFGLYRVALTITGQPIGMCGILKRNTLDMPDIGYALLPAYEGKGYAYEAAWAVMDHAFNELGLPQVAAITDPSNQRSIALLEKLGMTYSKMITSGDRELMLFIKDARTYR
ncbi:GNAT family N-acetyltransferase [Mucilaginibacter daejeonensis]|uniref:GNAT family N-acetyltransferase n=1 Tax=Mucilaginibacter daejeonensis TaxID=398049 RepID=UPI001D1750CF|nr:GNAT family N-acetyltransferase [Mucilaginibacter daejeonensis]UEG53321.1 GNAT family N-acetyltransferase [Mucilaginibacter daejeonensis]